MNATLALREEHWRELLAMLELDVETAGFLLGGLVQDDDELTFLGRSLSWVPDEHYLERSATSLVIGSRGYIPALGAAAADQAVPVFVHAHPRMGAPASPRDDGVDEGAAREAGPAAKPGRYHASLIVGGTSERPTFSGRVYDERGFVAQLGRLRVVGDASDLHAEGAADQSVDDEIFDRQMRAFGKDGQRLLARLRVGVVGAGGTGSAVFEQLVRLGVRQMTVIDDDVATTTNVTRIHESGVGDAGTAKVGVLATAERIGLGTDSTVINGRITDPGCRQPRCASSTSSSAAPTTSAGASSSRSWR